MILLIIGILGWYAAHFLPIFFAPQRAALAEKMGLKPSRGIIAIAVFASLFLIVIGYQGAEIVDVWYPPAFLTHMNNLLMVLGIFVYLASNLPSPVKRWIRHPQLTAVKIWAVAHLLVNGDLASVVLFGSMLAWAVLSVIGSNRRDGPRTEMPETTRQGLIANIALTAVVFAVIIYVHGMLLDVWPLPH